MPVHLAGQPCRPRPDLGARDPVSRTPRTPPRAPTAAARSAGSPTRPASRSTRRRTSPPARAASSRRTATTSRTAIRRPAAHAPRRRLALRHRRARLQGEPLRRPRGDRARPARQAVERTPRDRSGSSRSTTRRVAGLDGIEPLARDPRDTHALHLYVVRVDAEPGRRDARRATSGRSRRSGSRRRSTSCPCTG